MKKIIFFQENAYLFGCRCRLRRHRRRCHCELERRKPRSLRYDLKKTEKLEREMVSLREENREACRGRLGAKILKQSNQITSII